MAPEIDWKQNWNRTKKTLIKLVINPSDDCQSFFWISYGGKVLTLAIIAMIKHAMHQKATTNNPHKKLLLLPPVFRMFAH
jgi:hypothetical protein